MSFSCSSPSLSTTDSSAPWHHVSWNLSQSAKQVDLTSRKQMSCWRALQRYCICCVWYIEVASPPGSCFYHCSPSQWSSSSWGKKELAICSSTLKGGEIVMEIKPVTFLLHHRDLKGLKGDSQFIVKPVLQQYTYLHVCIKAACRLLRLFLLSVLAVKR